jgi:TIR domain-containing protein
MPPYVFCSDQDNAIVARFAPSRIAPPRHKRHDEFDNPISFCENSLMTDIFISYSRKDSQFACQLFDAMEAAERESWIDWEGIPYSPDGWHEICAAIDSARIPWLQKSVTKKSSAPIRT